MMIKMIQTHRAVVEEYSTYTLNEEEFKEFLALPENRREEFLFNYDADSSTSTILELIETTDTDIEW